MSFFIMAFSILLLDHLTVWGIKKSFPGFANRHKKGIRVAFVIQVTFSLIVVLSGFFLSRNIRDYRLFAGYYYVFGLVLAFYLPKMLFIGCAAIDHFLSERKRRKRRKQYLSPLDSRHMIAKTGAILSLFYFALILWGILFGRYNYTIEHVEVKSASLPPAFDGFKIAQISDVHAGSSAGMLHRFETAVKLINGQNPDLIVFTGDMVNNFAEEAVPLVPVFSQLTAREGKYAVLGNHDYGGYYDWKTISEREKNLSGIREAITGMGFKILENESVVFTRDSLEQIALVGVENWGIEERHPKKADFGKAVQPVRDIPFKILLSHDPSFWVERIVGKTDIALTLSGHTHGMQLGIKLGKTRYSPARARYEYWAGLYRQGDQYLYINRGLGVIGYPGRIGMSPEITLIELKRMDR